MRHVVMGVALVLFGAVPALAQDEPRVSLSTSVNYSVGDYGTGKDTTIVYIHAGREALRPLLAEPDGAIPLSARPERRHHRRWGRVT